MTKPIKLADFNVQPNAKVVVSGTLAFANITQKNQKSKFTPTYGLTIDNPTYSTPDKDPNSSAFKNDANLCRFLMAHEKREENRHGRDRLHLTWKDNGKLKGQHMPIAGQANQQQLQAKDSGNVLAKRDSNNHVLGKDGQPIEVNGKPTNNVSDIPDADDKVAFKQLASGQQVKVTFISFASKNYGNRVGTTIRALVVNDLDNLQLYNGQSNISDFGLTPDGDNTVKIQITPDSNQSAANSGQAPQGNPFASQSNNNSAKSTQTPKSSNSNSTAGSASAKSSGSTPKKDDNLPF